jgi:hypothetical protein
MLYAHGRCEALRPAWQAHWSARWGGGELRYAGGGGVGGESFLCVHWLAVPEALRARRVNRGRRLRPCCFGRGRRPNHGRGGRGQWAQAALGPGTGVPPPRRSDHDQNCWSD